MRLAFDSNHHLDPAFFLAFSSLSLQLRTEEKSSNFKMPKISLKTELGASNGDLNGKTGYCNR